MTTSEDLSEQYLVYEYSSTDSNTLNIKIREEGHTLANILSERLHLDPRCTFSAYKVPHPLEESVELKVTAHKDTPVILLVKETIRQIEKDFEKLLGNVRIDKEKNQ